MSGRREGRGTDGDLALGGHTSAKGIPSSEVADERLTILAPGHGERNYWRDLWHYRELFAILAWRDISVRYKQTVIGVAWAVLRPALTLVVFSIIFGKLAKLPSDGNAPYPLMVFAGLLPWFLFSSILLEASNSLIGNTSLISKVYFPRLTMPLATVGVALIDFAISLALFVPLMLWYGFLPGWQVLMLPLFVLLAVAASLGPALLITALNVKYRDFRYIIPFVVQFGLYVSPVGFTSAVVPESWRVWYGLNPIVGVIDGFRWCLLGGESPIHWPSMTASLVISVVFVWFGLRVFRTMERTMADVI